MAHQKSNRKRTLTPAELERRQRKVERLLAEQPPNTKWTEPIPPVVEDGRTIKERLVHEAQEAVRNMDQRAFDSYIESLRKITQPTRRLEQPKPKTRGEIIRGFREECGWTTEQLAEEIDMDQSSVSRHEHGAALRVPTLKKYADAFSKKLGRKITVADLRDQ